MPLSRVLVRAGVLLVIIVAVVLAWRSLWQEYPKAQEGLFSRRIDSYQPSLGSLGPELLKSHKEAERFLAYYDLIERDFPGSTGIGEMRGYCHYYSGDFAAALADYEKALRANPDSFVARYDLGVIYFKRARFDKALGYFQQAVAVPEARALSYVMGARVLAQFRIVKGYQVPDMLLRSRVHYGDAKRFIKLCMVNLDQTRELRVLAEQYKDLFKIWLENGGQPTTKELIIF